MTAVQDPVEVHPTQVDVGQFPMRAIWGEQDVDGVVLGCFDAVVVCFVQFGLITSITNVVSLINVVGVRDIRYICRI